MSSIFKVTCVTATLLVSLSATAQIGEPFIHDPSTVMKCDGKYYTFGNRRGRTYLR